MYCKAANSTKCTNEKSEVPLQFGYGLADILYYRRWFLIIMSRKNSFIVYVIYMGMKPTSFECAYELLFVIANTFSRSDKTYRI